jgi:hypothetical protein
MAALHASGSPGRPPAHGGLEGLGIADLLLKRTRRSVRSPFLVRRPTGRDRAPSSDAASVRCTIRSETSGRPPRATACSPREEGTTLGYVR